MIAYVVNAFVAARIGIDTVAKRRRSNDGDNKSHPSVRRTASLVTPKPCCYSVCVRAVSFLNQEMGLLCRRRNLA